MDFFCRLSLSRILPTPRAKSTQRAATVPPSEHPSLCQMGLPTSDGRTGWQSGLVKAASANYLSSCSHSCSHSQRQAAFQDSCLLGNQAELPWHGKLISSGCPLALPPSCVWSCTTLCWHLTGKRKLGRGILGCIRSSVSWSTSTYSSLEHLRCHLPSLRQSRVASWVRDSVNSSCLLLYCWLATTKAVTDISCSDYSNVIITGITS